MFSPKLTLATDKKGLPLNLTFHNRECRLFVCYDEKENHKR